MDILVSKEIRLMMKNIYERCVCLNIKSYYLNYYFEIRNNLVILTGFTDIEIFKSQVGMDATIYIDDLFDVYDLDFKWRPYLKNSNYGNITIITGSSLDEIIKFNLIVPFLYNFKSKNVKIIYDRAFFETSLLTIICNEVNEIEQYSFGYCKYLESAILPKCELLSIGSFIGDINLKKVTLNKSVYINNLCFYACHNLKESNIITV